MYGRTGLLMSRVSRVAGGRLRGFNVYNIAAIRTIVDHYPVEGIRSREINWLGLPWSRKPITIGGNEYALGEIENDILVEGFEDLRIHFGINCASVGCIDLATEPYRADKLYQQLEKRR
jgi:hypothetical protein